MNISSSLRSTFILAGALTCLCALTAHAQTVATQVTPTSTATSPAKAIGPAPANSTQHQILSKALSPETRQTLQEAMSSSEK